MNTSGLPGSFMAANRAPKKKAPEGAFDLVAVYQNRVLYPEPDGRHVRAGYQTAARAIA